MSNAVPDAQRAEEVLAKKEEQAEEEPHGEYDTVGIDNDR